MHPALDVAFDEVRCFFTLPAKHLGEEIVAEVIDHEVGRDDYNNDIVLLALLDELVIVNLGLIPEKPVFLVADDGAVVEFSCVDVIKQSQHIRPLVGAECAAQSEIGKVGVKVFLLPSLLERPNFYVFRLHFAALGLILLLVSCIGWRTSSVGGGPIGS